MLRPKDVRISRLASEVSVEKLPEVVPLLLIVVRVGAPVSDNGAASLAYDRNGCAAAEAYGSDHVRGAPLEELSPSLINNPTHVRVSTEHNVRRLFSLGTGINALVDFRRALPFLVFLHLGGTPFVVM